MKMVIKWSAILIAGFALNANAWIFTNGYPTYHGASRGVVDGTTTNIVGPGGQYEYIYGLNVGYQLIIESGSTLTVASNGSLSVTYESFIGSASSGNRLVLQNGSHTTFGDDAYVGYSAGSNGNVLDIQRGASVIFPTGSGLYVGTGGGTDNTLILGADIDVHYSVTIRSGNTIIFDGGRILDTASFYFYSGAVVEFTSGYNVGDVIVAADNAASMNWTNILAAFNAAGAAQGYEFELGNPTKTTGSNTLIVTAVPEPASALMFILGAGFFGFYRRHLQIRQRKTRL